MSQLTVPAVPRTDRLAQIWSQLSAADRVVLLGHDRPVLDAEDTAALAKVARGAVVDLVAPRGRGGRSASGRRNGRTRRT